MIIYRNNGTNRLQNHKMSAFSMPFSHLQTAILQKFRLSVQVNFTNVLQSDQNRQTTITLHKTGCYAQQISSIRGGKCPILQSLSSPSALPFPFSPSSPLPVPSPVAVAKKPRRVFDAFQLQTVTFGKASAGNSLEKTQVDPLCLSENLISQRARQSNRAEKLPSRPGFKPRPARDLSPSGQQALWPIQQSSPLSRGNRNKQARYRRQSALQKYNCKKRASNIALSYSVDVDK